MVETRSRDLTKKAHTHSRTRALRPGQDRHTVRPGHVTWPTRRRRCCCSSLAPTRTLTTRTHTHTHTHTHLDTHTYAHTLAQVLLFPGTKFRVVDSMDMGAGLFMVHLEELELPADLFR